MVKKNLPKPSEGELQVLRVLWKVGSCSVREVHSQINPNGETGYTTTLKIMQIMSEKGLVHRDESRRTHLYTAALKESDVQKRFASDLLDSLFQGSAHKLVLHALSSRNTSAEEIAEIKKIIDQAERKLP